MGVWSVAPASRPRCGCGGGGGGGPPTVVNWNIDDAMPGCLGHV